MNFNGRVLTGSCVVFLTWALLTGALIAWKLTFACLGLRVLLHFMLLYWSANLSCSVELREQGGKNEGDFEITYIFANNGLLPIPRCQVSVHLEKELGSVAFAPEMLGFSISEIKSLRKAFQCPRRGIYSVGGATVTLWDPLGIGSSQRRFDKQMTVEVFPHKYPVESLLTSGREEGGGIRGNWDAEQDFTSIRRIREAFPQESVRYVHWKASARMEELQIREYETRKRCGILIVLDSNADKYANDVGGKREERCVEVAAGLIGHWLEKGYGVEMITGAGAILELRGTAAMDAALRALMVFRPEGCDTFAHEIEKLQRGKRENKVLQIITPELHEQEAFSIHSASNLRLSLFLVGSQENPDFENLQVVKIPV